MKTMAIALLCSLTLYASAETASLKLTRTIPLPGVKGRFDHFAVDVTGHRLFVAALGNDTLEVLDVSTGKHLQSITGLHKPTGVTYYTAANEIGVANGDDGTFKIFNGTSYAATRKLSSLDDADNVRLDAKGGLTYVGFGSGSLAIVDPTAMKLSSTIPLAGHPESFQLETAGNRIFVNVPDAKHVAVVDREKQTVVATWAMTKFQANFPIEQRDADTYRIRERIPTRSGAQTSFFTAERDEFYLAVPSRGKQEAEIQIFKPQE